MQLEKITAVLATSALVAGGGIGVAQAASDGSTGAGTTKQARRGPGAAHLKTLADKLGVTTTQLEAAMEAIRPAAPAKGDRAKGGDMAADLAKGLGVETAFDKLEAEHAERDAAMATALAKELDLDADDVAAALKETRPAKPAPRG